MSSIEASRLFSQDAPPELRWQISRAIYSSNSASMPALRRSGLSACRFGGRRDNGRIALPARCPLSLYLGYTLLLTFAI